MSNIVPIDIELDNIKELIREAYVKDANRVPLINVRDGKLHYPMIGLWCKDTIDRTLLLRIIHKLISMYPHRTVDMTEHLLDKIPVTEDSTLEICWLVGFISAAQVFAEEPENNSVILELFRDAERESLDLSGLNKTLKEIIAEDKDE